MGVALEGRGVGVRGVRRAWGAGWGVVWSRDGAADWGLGQGSVVVASQWQGQREDFSLPLPNSTAPPTPAWGS